MVRSSDSTGWRNRYCDAATENAKVLTASSRPRTRSAPTPMSAARPAETNAAMHDGEQERQRREVEVHHADVEVQTTRQRGRDQGAEARRRPSDRATAVPPIR